MEWDTSRVHAQQSSLLSNLSSSFVTYHELGFPSILSSINCRPHAERVIIRQILNEIYEIKTERIKMLTSFSTMIRTHEWPLSMQIATLNSILNLFRGMDEARTGSSNDHDEVSRYAPIIGPPPSSSADVMDIIKKEVRLLICERTEIDSAASYFNEIGF